MTIQSDNVAGMQANNFIQMGKRIIIVKGSFSIGKPYSNITNKITNNNETWMPLAYVNDSSNSINITNGIANRVISPSGAFCYMSTGTTLVNFLSAACWKSGSYIYFGVNISSLSTNSNAISSIGVPSAIIITDAL